MRDSTTLLRSQCDALRKLDPEQFYAAVTALWDYEMDGIRPCGDMPEAIKPMIERWIEEAKKKDREIHRKSAAYKAWRTSVITRDDFTCQICGQVGGVLNAHHIKQFAYYPDLRFDVNNGVTLCRSCHVKVHRLMRRKGIR